MFSSERAQPAAAGLALLSGALMMIVGYVAATSIATALWISVVPGVTIEVAFWLLRRADRAAKRPEPTTTTRVLQEGVILLAGAVMALAGYAGATWTWLWTVPLVALGGVTIEAAAALGRRAPVHNGRFTADIDGDFVVLLIGLRFNKPLKVHKWLPVASQMAKMVRVLDQHPELGCLGYRQWYGPTTVMVQYWRDFESLNRFARDTTLPHLEPWRRFNQAVRDSGDVGIWHETYRVRAHDYETIYGNMPVFGLAAASHRIPVADKAHAAAARIGLAAADEPAVAPY